MTVKFEWTEDYSIGHAELDNQHKHLFSLGNKISNAHIGDAKTYVMELYRYARQHFDLEEAHMKAIGFPDLDGHRLLHNKLLSDLNAITENFFAKKDAFEDFKSFLYNWLVEHVLQRDKKYFAFARQHR